MLKVGILLMGKSQSSNTKVKEIVLEVQAKTRLKNVIEYLVELNKIVSTDMFLTYQKNGIPLTQDTTISQVLKKTKPVNGVLKLFLYEQNPNAILQKLQLGKMRNKLNNSSAMLSENSKGGMKDSQSGGDEQKRCCCF